MSDIFQNVDLCQNFSVGFRRFEEDKEALKAALEARQKHLVVDLGNSKKEVSVSNCLTQGGGEVARLPLFREGRVRERFPLFKEEGESARLPCDPVATFESIGTEQNLYLLQNCM